MTAQDDNRRLEKEQLLRQMSDDWVKALVRGDAATLERVMADDFFFAYPMEGDDKSTFINDVTSTAIKVDHLSRENVRVRIFSSTAVITSKDSAQWWYQGRDVSGHYKTIQVYAERDGQWQLVSVQACPLS